MKRAFAFAGLLIASIPVEAQPMKSPEVPSAGARSRVEAKRRELAKLRDNPHRLKDLRKDSCERVLEKNNEMRKRLECDPIPMGAVQNIFAPVDAGIYIPHRRIRGPVTDKHGRKIQFWKERKIAGKEDSLLLVLRGWPGVPL